MISCERAFRRDHGRPRLGPKRYLVVYRDRAAFAAPGELSAGAPGSGSIVLETAKGKVGVIDVQLSYVHANRFWRIHFARLDETVAKMREERQHHCRCSRETTSEKIAMGRFLDGKVSAVIGTHTHVQTADEQVLPAGLRFCVMPGCAVR